MSLFRTMDEINREMLERNAKLLADAEATYYREFNRAISAIHQAHTDLVCFGEKEAWFGDMMMEEALRMAIHAERFYNDAKALYDEALEICKK